MKTYNYRVEIRIDETELTAFAYVTSESGDVGSVDLTAQYAGNALADLLTGDAEKDMEIHLVP